MRPRQRKRERDFAGEEQCREMPRVSLSLSHFAERRMRIYVAGRPVDRYFLRALFRDEISNGCDGVFETRRIKEI